MSDEYRDDWTEIIRLSKLEDEGSLTTLTRYVMEGIRIISAAAGVSRMCAKDIIVADGKNNVTCSAGDMVFIDLVYAFYLRSDNRITPTKIPLFSPNQLKSNSIVLSTNTFTSDGVHIPVLPVK